MSAGDDVRGRVLTTVRCRARRHVLARLVAREGDGHRLVVVPRLAVADVDERRPGRTVLSGKLGGHVIDLDDEGNGWRMDGFLVACACGSEFHLNPSQLMPRPLMEDRGGVRYRVEGRTVPPPSLLLLDPVGATRWG